MEIGQFFNIKNRVGMKTKDEMIIAAETVLGKAFKYALKCILIQTVLATVVRITKTAEGVCFSRLSSFPWLLKTFPSMKVTLEKYFNINTIRIKEKTNPIVTEPKIIPKANMKLQKLSLFTKGSKSVPRKLFSTTLLSMGACNSCLTILSNFVGLSIFLSALGLVLKDVQILLSKLGWFLQNVAKSSMVFSYNLWFQIYSNIISKYYQFFKQIKVLVLVISLVLWGNSVVVLADDKVTIGYSEKELSLLIANAEREHQIPAGLLAAIAKTESRMKAYALNVGGRSMFPMSISQAQVVLEDKLNAGLTNIDVGVMQLNYRWHGGEFDSLVEMLIPESNINYAAKLLGSLYARHGTWHKAVRYYHSATPKHHKKYSRKVVMCWLNS